MRNCLWLSIVLLFFSTTISSAEEHCGVAGDIGARAYSEFQSNPASSISLFIKAHELCSSEPAHVYNVGLSYLKINDPRRAIPYLEEAVANNPRPVWLNNLGEAYLSKGEYQRAVETAQKSSTMEPTAHAAAIIARGYISTGGFERALRTVQKADSTWPDSTELARVSADIISTYLDHYLGLVKKRDISTGLGGLEKTIFLKDGLKAYTLALASVGRYQEALAVIEQKRADFGNDQELQNLHANITQSQIKKFYSDYSRGQRAESVSRAKAFAELYPADSQVQEAYDELLEALLSDIEQIESVNIKARPMIASDTPNSRESSMLTEFQNDLSADEKIELVVDVDKDIPKAARKNKDGVAVVIGNQRYQRENQGIADVIYAERDAAIMRKYLIESFGFDEKNIIYERNATLGTLRNIFGTDGSPGKLHNFVRDGRSDVFIYYVGHGAPGPDGKASYIVPIDANVDFIANNGFNIDQLYASLGRLKAKNITVVLDACFSGDSFAGPLFQNISPAMLRSVQPVRDLKRGVVMTGSGKGQVCTWYQEKNHSLFTYFFLKGIGGKADADGNRKISVKELKEYLHDEVPYVAKREANREQTPVIKGDETIILAHLQ